MKIKTLGLKRNDTFKLILLFFTIISLISKLYYGLDIDEQYTLSMGYRIYSGDQILKSIWDPYQLSALFIVPIYTLNKFLFNSFAHIIFNIRIIGLLIQAIIAYTVYRAFKKNISQDFAYIAGLTYLILLPKQTLIIDHSNLLNWFSTLLTISLFYFFQTKKIIYLIITGILLSLAVIAYPTQAILLALIMIILMIYQKKNCFKYSILLASVCFILFIFFISYILTYMSLPNIVFNAIMITKEGSHSISIIARIFEAFISFSVIFIASSTFAFILAIIFSYIQAHHKNKILSLSDLYCTNMIIFWPLTIIMLLSLGIVWPPLAMYRRHLIYILLFFITVYAKKKFNRNEMIFIIIPIFISSICLLTSNQGIDSACGYLSCAVAYVITKIIEYISTKNIKISKYLFVTFLLGQCIIVGYTARVTSTPGFPITKLITSEIELIKPVKIQEKDDILFNSVLNIKKDVENKKTLYVGSNSLIYLLTNADVCAPLTISTPIYDDQWVTYYKETNSIPERIIIDKTFYDSIDKFKLTTLGNYLLDNSNYSLILENKNIMLLSLEK